MTLQLSSAVYLSVVCKPARVKIYVAVSLLQNFASVCKVLGPTIYASTSFLPRPAPTPPAKVNLQVYECIGYGVFSASAQKRLNVYAIKICTETFRNLTMYLHLNFLELYRVPAPEPCATWPAICIETLKPPQVSTPGPSRTSPGICTGTLQNLNTVSAQEPSGTSPATCTETQEPSRTWTLQNLTRYLHRNPEPSGTWTGTLRNPELILAKDPIAKFCCWGKRQGCWPGNLPSCFEGVLPQDAPPTDGGGIDSQMWRGCTSDCWTAKDYLRGSHPDLMSWPESGMQRRSQVSRLSSLVRRDSRSGRRDSQGGNRQVKSWTSTQRERFEHQLQLVAMTSDAEEEVDSSWKGPWMKDVRGERWGWSDCNTRTRCRATQASVQLLEHSRFAFTAASLDLPLQYLIAEG